MPRGRGRLKGQGARFRARLLSVLRDDLELTGSRYGCGRGDCGACYVLVGGRAVPACTLPVEEAEGLEVVTVEGLAAGDTLPSIRVRVDPGETDRVSWDMGTFGSMSTAAVAALDVTWADPPPPGPPTFDGLLRDDDGVGAAFAGAATVLEARFEVPHISHAYVATQRPFALRDLAAEALGLSPEQVHVHPQAMGGMYGRGSANDAPMEALRLAKAVGRPVLVQWTRADEFRMAPHRPRVTTAAWPDYPIARMRDAPEAIVVRFLGDEGTPSTGVGEPGSVPVAAAIANGIFAARGVRVRRLPITREGVRAAAAGWDRPGPG